MLKFIKGNLESIMGIEIYPRISLGIFFIFFSAVVIMAFKMKKSTIKEISDLPLND